MKPKFNKIKLLIGILLVLFGIAITCFVFCQENRQNRENVVVEATVTGCVMTYEEYDVVDSEYDREYRIDVEYTYDGETYESFVEYSSEKRVGKKIKIHINPDDPTETDGMYGGLTDYIATILFCAVPFLLVGVLLVISALKNRKKTQQGGQAKISSQVSE